jgi:hypothetical protein
MLHCSIICCSMRHASLLHDLLFDAFLLHAPSFAVPAIAALLPHASLR